MAKINLLPWRAERRRQREREFYMMLGAAALAAVALLFGWWYWMGMRLDNQDARNAYLKDQIKQFEKAINQSGNAIHLRSGQAMQPGGKRRRPKMR